ncbi:MAG: branched-chain amino acid ABC transporter permease [Candidatus Hermodarchaeota archaeon]
MVEKEENSKSNQEEIEITVKTRYPIGEPFKNISHRISKGTKHLVSYQLPAAGKNFKSWIKSFRGGIILICLILVSFIPLLIGESDPVYYHTFVLAMIYAILAASWDLLAGVTGQVSFGHAAFFGIGGYVCAYFITYLGFNLILSVIIGGFLAAVIGLIIAIPCLRFRGPYLALGTLAFSLLLFILFSMASLKDWFWGQQGISLPQSVVFSYTLNYSREFITVLIFMIICIVLILAIFNSKLGTVFQAIRDNETAARAAGINTTKYKLFSFMISAFFAGIAGSLYILHYNHAVPSIYSTTMSFYPVIMTCLGGIAMISGAVLGAYFFALSGFLIEEILRILNIQVSSFLLTHISTLAFAVILLIIIRFTERGILDPAIKQTKSLWDIILGK